MRIILLSFVAVLNSCTTLEAFRGPASKEVVVCPSETRRTVAPDFVPKDKTKIKVAFFDADSTLRISKIEKSVTATKEDDVLLLPHMSQALRKLEQENYLIYIVSNQGGVSTQKTSCAIAEKALQYTMEQIKKDNGVIHGYDFAENYDDSRKPSIGMALKLELVLKYIYGNEAAIDKANSIMVGDSAFQKGVDYKKLDANGNWIEAISKEEGAVEGTHHTNSDRLFAKNYGIQFYEAAVFFGWRKNGIDVFESAQQLDDYLKSYP